MDAGDTATILKILGCVMIALVVIFLFPRKGLEKFEPEDMGGRRFWGFGRNYGYSLDDTHINMNFCYQTTPYYVCVPGYSRRRNELTGRDECCVNRFNY